MIDALWEAFHGDKPKTPSAMGIVRGAARELCLAQIDPAQVPALYRRAKGMGWPDFTPRAIAQRLPDLMTPGLGKGREQKATVYDADIVRSTPETVTKPKIYFEPPPHLKHLFSEFDVAGVEHESR